MLSLPAPASVTRLMLPTPRLSTLLARAAIYTDAWCRQIGPPGEDLGSWFVIVRPVPPPPVAVAQSYPGRPKDTPEQRARLAALELGQDGLGGSGHRDHMMDLFNSRPTLGAIRESQRKRTLFQARGRAQREGNDAKREIRAGQPAPVPIRCTWCGVTRPESSFEVGVCGPCATNPTARRIRSHQLALAALKREAAWAAPGGTTAPGTVRTAPAVNVAVPTPPPPVAAPAPALKLRRVLQPDGSVRFVRS